MTLPPHPYLRIMPYPSAPAVLRQWCTQARKENE